ncbi:hypothetical protein RB597_009703 [Gaeumannomyces tritici]
MLRTTGSTMLRRSVLQAGRASPAAPMACRAASTRALSKPMLANIEKRWEGMPLQEQAELWMALRDRMKENWAELSLQEKKAAYWIAFGAHGPRALDPPGEGKRVALYVAVGMGVSLALFALIRSLAGPAPSTMTKEWQEQTNEYLKVCARLGESHHHEMQCADTRCHGSLKTRIPSPVFRPRGTWARAWSSPPRPSVKYFPFISLSQYQSAARPHGHLPMYKSFDGMLRFAGIFAQGGWCKYHVLRRGLDDIFL